MTTSKPRFSITLDAELFDKLDNYRFKCRFQSRSQAAADLIRKALEALDEDGAENEIQQEKEYAPSK